MIQHVHRADLKNASCGRARGVRSLDCLPVQFELENLVANHDQGTLKTTSTTGCFDW